MTFTQLHMRRLLQLSLSKYLIKLSSFIDNIIFGKTEEIDFDKVMIKH